MVNDKPLATTEEQNMPLAAQNHKWRMEGEDEEDRLIPRVILHQGDISEKYHGEFEKGTLFNSATREVIECRRFVCIGHAWKEWVKWTAGRDGQWEYRTRDKNDVPPEDLTWSDDGTPPAAQLTRNFIILFEDDPVPICLQLQDKKKLQRLAGKSLNQLEKLRATKRRGPGLYELEIVDQENEKGRWKEMRVRPVGNPSPELLEELLMWHDALSTADVQVHENGDFDPDNED